MANFNYLNNIIDETLVVLQKPNEMSPGFLTESKSWESININIDSESFHSGLSYNDFLTKYVNKDIFNNQSNRPVLETMLRCASLIFSKFQLLEELGIHFTMFLAGGAVREIISGKAELVKDFDFFISFKDHYLEKSLDKEVFLSNPKIIEFKKKYPEHLFFKSMTHYVKNYFNLEAVNKIYLEEYNSCIPKLEVENTLSVIINNKTEVIMKDVKGYSWYINISILADLLLQDFNSQLYSKVKSLSHINDINYVDLVDNNTVIGIIKLSSLEMPCDIMFIETGIHHFQNFDWEICKGGLILYSPPYKENYKIFDNEMGGKLSNNVEKMDMPVFNSLPKNAESCVSRFFSVGDFLKDISKKEITYNVFLKHPKIIYNQMVERKSRLKEKYSDYKVVWNMDFFNNLDVTTEKNNETQIQEIKIIIEESIMEDLIPVNIPKSVIKNKKF